MSVFIRRFEFDPGIEVFLEIEAVNILDLEPPGSISGVGTGTALLVGEFEDGPFEVPTEVTSATDLAKNFGSFGYTYAGITGNYPCARKRLADGAIVPEYWNGNGLIALNGKKFRRLLLCRVDTSVGEEQFNRLAWLKGGSSFSYALATAQTFIYAHGTASFTTTFTALPAIITSGAGVYPSLFVGGETLTLNIDGTQYVIVFQAADQTQAQVIARINAAVGFTCAIDAGGGITTLQSVIAGTSGVIQIVAGTASVLAAINIAAGAPVNGTGNVGNILLVKPSEIDAAVNTTSAGAFRVVQLDDGSLRLENRLTPLTGVARVTGGTATAALGFSVSENAAWQDSPQQVLITQIDAAVIAALGFALSGPSADDTVLVSAAGVYPTLFAGGEKMTIQVGSNAPVIVTFQAADQTQAQVIARINLALGYTAAKAQSATITALAGLGTNTTTIPAGTLLRNAGGNLWVTMLTTDVSASDPGPYDIKVRPAVDDGSASSAGIGTVTLLARQTQNAAWSVNNPLAFSGALSEAAIDAKYLTALTATLNPSSVAAIANLIWSARQSNAVRGGLRANANDASASGLYGRMAAIRPPLGTSRAMAKSSAAQPGVGAYRSQRVIYCYPGVQTFVPAIAAKGTAGGDGYTADGVIDTGADGFMVSVCSQLPPEENPGQLTTFAAGALGVEKNNADVQNLTINDYIAFRGAGIAAPRVDGGVMIFQSGVTSVDPAVQPSLRNIARRRMADFIQDSLALRMKAFGKKLNTRTRRALIAGEIRAFMTSLLSPGNAAAQRIDGFTLDVTSGNTPATLALGIFRILLNVRTLSSLDAIVLQTTIGESVDVSEAALRGRKGSPCRMIRGSEGKKSKFASFAMASPRRPSHRSRASKRRSNSKRKKTASSGKSPTATTTSTTVWTGS